MAAQKPLVLVGGGGHCRSCIDVIQATGDWRIVAILDLPSRLGEPVLDFTINGTDAEIERHAAESNFLITVGQVKNADARVGFYNRIRAAGARLATIVSPQAYVSPHARLGEGSIVMHRAVVNCGAVTGDNVIVNTMALIEHDASIGSHCHVSTAAVVNGGVIVGERSFIGSNAVLHHGVRVPDGTVISAGAIYRMSE